MATETQVYRDLQKHPDRLPAGFPPTESGVEIRILKHLFTPEEAKMAIELSMMPEDLEKQLRPQEIIDLLAYLSLDRPPDDTKARKIPGTPR